MDFASIFETFSSPARKLDNALEQDELSSIFNPVKSTSVPLSPEQLRQQEVQRVASEAEAKGAEVSTEATPGTLLGEAWRSGKTQASINAAISKAQSMGDFDSVKELTRISQEARNIAYSKPPEEMDGWWDRAIVQMGESAPLMARIWMTQAAQEVGLMGAEALAESQARKYAGKAAFDAFKSAVGKGLTRAAAREAAVLAAGGGTASTGVGAPVGAGIAAVGTAANIAMLAWDVVQALRAGRRLMAIPKAIAPIAMTKDDFKGQFIQGQVAEGKDPSQIPDSISESVGILNAAIEQFAVINPLNVAVSAAEKRILGETVRVGTKSMLRSLGSYAARTGAKGAVELSEEFWQPLVDKYGSEVVNTAIEKQLLENTMEAVRQTDIPSSDMVMSALSDMNEAVPGVTLMTLLGATPGAISVGMQSSRVNAEVGRIRESLGWTEEKMKSKYESIARSAELGEYLDESGKAIKNPDQAFVDSIRREERAGRERKAAEQVRLIDEERVASDAREAAYIDGVNAALADQSMTAEQMDAKIDELATTFWQQENPNDQMSLEEGQRPRDIVGASYDPDEVNAGVKVRAEAEAKNALESQFAAIVESEKAQRGGLSDAEQRSLKRAIAEQLVGNEETPGYGRYGVKVEDLLRDGKATPESVLEDSRKRRAEDERQEALQRTKKAASAQRIRLIREKNKQIMQLQRDAAGLGLKAEIKPLKLTDISLVEADGRWDVDSTEADQAMSTELDRLFAAAKDNLTRDHEQRMQALKAADDKRIAAFSIMDRVRQDALKFIKPNSSRMNVALTRAGSEQDSLDSFRKMVADSLIGTNMEGRYDGRGGRIRFAVEVLGHEINEPAERVKRSEGLATQAGDVYEASKKAYEEKAAGLNLPPLAEYDVAGHTDKQILRAAAALDRAIAKAEAEKGKEPKKEKKSEEKKPDGAESTESGSAGTPAPTSEFEEIAPVFRGQITDPDRASILNEVEEFFPSGNEKQITRIATVLAIRFYKFSDRVFTLEDIVNGQRNLRDTKSKVTDNTKANIAQLLAREVQAGHLERVQGGYRGLTKVDEKGQAIYPGISGDASVSAKKAASYARLADPEMRWAKDVSDGLASFLGLSTYSVKTAKDVVKSIVDGIAKDVERNTAFVPSVGNLSELNDAISRISDNRGKIREQFRSALESFVLRHNREMQEFVVKQKSAKNLPAEVKEGAAEAYNAATQLADDIVFALELANAGEKPLTETHEDIKTLVESAFSQELPESVAEAMGKLGEYAQQDDAGYLGYQRGVVRLLDEMVRQVDVQAYAGMLQDRGESPISAFILAADLLKVRHSISPSALIKFTGKPLIRHQETIRRIDEENARYKKLRSEMKARHDKQLVAAKSKREEVKKAQRKESATAKEFHAKTIRSIELYESREYVNELLEGRLPSIKDAAELNQILKRTRSTRLGQSRGLDKIMDRIVGYVDKHSQPNAAGQRQGTEAILLAHQDMKNPKTRDGMVIQELLDEVIASEKERGRELSPEQVERFRDRLIAEKIVQYMMKTSELSAAEKWEEGATPWMYELKTIGKNLRSDIYKITRTAYDEVVDVKVKGLRLYPEYAQPLIKGVERYYYHQKFGYGGKAKAGQRSEMFGQQVFASEKTDLMKHRSRELRAALRKLKAENDRRMAADPTLSPRAKEIIDQRDLSVNALNKRADDIVSWAQMLSAEGKMIERTLRALDKSKGDSIPSLEREMRLVEESIESTLKLLGYDFDSKELEKEAKARNSSWALLVSNDEVVSAMRKRGKVLGIIKDESGDFSKRTKSDYADSPEAARMELLAKAEDAVRALDKASNDELASRFLDKSDKGNVEKIKELRDRVSSLQRTISGIREDLQAVAVYRMSLGREAAKESSAQNLLRNKLSFLRAQREAYRKQGVFSAAGERKVGGGPRALAERQAQVDKRFGDLNKAQRDLNSRIRSLIHSAIIPLEEDAGKQMVMRGDDAELEQMIRDGSFVTNFRMVEGTSGIRETLERPKGAKGETDEFGVTTYKGKARRKKEGTGRLHYRDAFITVKDYMDERLELALDEELNAKRDEIITEDTGETLNERIAREDAETKEEAEAVLKVVTDLASTISSMPTKTVEDKESGRVLVVGGSMSMQAVDDFVESRLDGVVASKARREAIKQAVRRAIYYAIRNESPRDTVALDEELVETIGVEAPLSGVRSERPRYEHPDFDEVIESGILSAVFEDWQAVKVEMKYAEDVAQLRNDDGLMTEVNTLSQLVMRYKEALDSGQDAKAEELKKLAVAERDHLRSLFQTEADVKAIEGMTKIETEAYSKRESMGRRVKGSQLGKIAAGGATEINQGPRVKVKDRPSIAIERMQKYVSSLEAQRPSEARDEKIRTAKGIIARAEEAGSGVVLEDDMQQVPAYIMAMAVAGNQRFQTSSVSGGEATSREGVDSYGRRVAKEAGGEWIPVRNQGGIVGTLRIGTKQITFRMGDAGVTPSGERASGFVKTGTAGDYEITIDPATGMLSTANHEVGHIVFDSLTKMQKEAIERVLGFKVGDLDGQERFVRENLETGEARMALADRILASTPNDRNIVARAINAVIRGVNAMLGTKFRPLNLGAGIGRLTAEELAEGLKNLSILKQPVGDGQMSGRFETAWERGKRLMENSLENANAYLSRGDFDSASVVAREYQKTLGDFNFMDDATRALYYEAQDIIESARNKVRFQTAQQPQSQQVQSWVQFRKENFTKGSWGTDVGKRFLKDYKARTDKSQTSLRDFYAGWDGGIDSRVQGAAKDFVDDVRSRTAGRNVAHDERKNNPWNITKRTVRKGAQQWAMNLPNIVRSVSPKMADYMQSRLKPQVAQTHKMNASRILDEVVTGRTITDEDSRKKAQQETEEFIVRLQTAPDVDETLGGLIPSIRLTSGERYNLLRLLLNEKSRRAVFNEINVKHNKTKTKVTWESFNGRANAYAKAELAKNPDYKKLSEAQDRIGDYMFPLINEQYKQLVDRKDWPTKDGLEKEEFYTALHRDMPWNTDNKDRSRLSQILKEVAIIKERKYSNRGVWLVDGFADLFNQIEMSSQFIANAVPAAELRKMIRLEDGNNTSLGDAIARGYGEGTVDNILEGLDQVEGTSYNVNQVEDRAIKAMMRWVARAALTGPTTFAMQIQAAFIPMMSHSAGAIMRGYTSTMTHDEMIRRLEGNPDAGAILARIAHSLPWEEAQALKYYSSDSRIARAGQAAIRKLDRLGFAATKWLDRTTVMLHGKVAWETVNERMPNATEAEKNAAFVQEWHNLLRWQMIGDPTMRVMAHNRGGRGAIFNMFRTTVNAQAMMFAESYMKAKQSGDPAAVREFFVRGSMMAFGMTAYASLVRMGAEKARDWFAELFGDDDDKKDAEDRQKFNKEHRAAIIAKEMLSNFAAQLPISSIGANVADVITEHALLDRPSQQFRVFSAPTRVSIEAQALTAVYRFTSAIERLKDASAKLEEEDSKKNRKGQQRALREMYKATLDLTRYTPASTPIPIWSNFLSLDKALFNLGDNQ